MENKMINPLRKDEFAKFGNVLTATQMSEVKGGAFGLQVCCNTISVKAKTK